MRGVVTFVFDDGYEAVFRQVVPVLDAARLPGVFAIPLNAQRNWQEWLPLRQRGHEIAAHSVSHRDLRILSADELQRELAEPADKLGAATLVYPGGAHDDRVVEEAKKYYAAARTVQRGYESLPSTDSYRLKTINWSRRNFSVTKANLFTIWAWLTNSWLIETYHLIDDKPTDVVHSVSLTDFKKHMHFVKKLPVTVKTIEQVIHET